MGGVSSDANILLPVQSIAGLIRLCQVLRILLFDRLDTTEKALVAAPMVPIVGGPLNAVRFVVKGFNETPGNVDKTLSVVDAE